MPRTGAGLTGFDHAQEPTADERMVVIIPASAKQRMTSSSGADPTSVPGWRMFTRLFAAAHQAGLPLVSVRPRARDPQTALAGGDYDLLMPPDGFAILVQVLWRLAAEERAHFSLVRLTAHKLQVHLHLPECQRSILLEVWTRLEVRDPARRSARAIPWSALAPRLRDTADGPRLPAEIEIAYYLSHLATRGKSLATPLVAERVAAYREQARREAPALAPLFDGLSDGRVRMVAGAANAHLRSLGVLAMRSALAATWDSLGARLESMRRARRRRALRRARIIALTGPDGSGKSTVIERWAAELAAGLVAQRFKNLFRHHPFYQLVYLMRAGATRRAMGGTLHKNAFDEIHAGTMFRIARAAWPWFRLLVAVRGRRCLDRGFPDLLFAGLRGTEAQPHLAADWQRLAKRMPLPDWHVHLDAPDEVIHSRKKELSLDALRCYRDGMARIIALAPADGFTRIDTSAPVETVLACLRLASDSLGVDLHWKNQR